MKDHQNSRAAQHSTAEQHQHQHQRLLVKSHDGATPQPYKPSPCSAMPHGRCPLCKVSSANRRPCAPILVSGRCEDVKMQMWIDMEKEIEMEVELEMELEMRDL
ncbi:hypothetical protein AWZ03_001455 [Drosophila navojoa]|uniref:Uncharacterized protein n=1 Tax=Drosophila navojoa TaxID=7232 RepID=A0A484BU42_DRONA|nr:hypothetical protein AWZ03_001455 [Drosophila navojoa]